MVVVVIIAIVLIVLIGVAAYDLLQRHHAVLRNFPVVGHLPSQALGRSTASSLLTLRASAQWL
jgi:uncharacterized membrane protein YqiK